MRPLLVGLSLVIVVMFLTYLSTIARASSAGLRTAPVRSMIDRRVGGLVADAHPAVPSTGGEGCRCELVQYDARQ